uniref:HEAT repeat-containing protein 5B n=1 Tax=Ditylenchus dipsaci TaxID=166011 RepID=A0A915D0I2_9BILA
MEQSNSLLLNEEALRQCPDPTKPVFVYEWLRYLDRILPATRKTDIKNCQQKLVEQLTFRISTGPGPPTRILLAKCIAQVFAIADTYDLFQTINICNDALKAKEDSGTPLQVKLTALCVLGTMYERLGRMVGRSYEESFQLMAKWIKSAESGSRAEILQTLAKMVHGLGSAGYSIHKDLYKLLSKTYLNDRVLNVRAAASKCLAHLVAESGSPIYNNDIDSMVTLCLKALDSSSNYEVRQEVAKVFAKLVERAYNLHARKSAAPVSPQPPPTSTKSSAGSSATVEDVLQLMSTAFLRGGVSGFLNLKSGLKSVNGVSSGAQHHKDTRIGIALSYVAVARELGVKWLEQNLAFWIKHLLDMTSKCGPIAYTNDPSQAAEVVFMRRCILYIFRQTLGQMLSEQYQITACKQLGALLNEYINCFDCALDTAEEERVLNVDAYSSAQASVVILLEISALVRQVGTSITSIFVEAQGIMEPVFGCLLHPINVTRVAAAWCLRNITLAVPSQSTPLIDRCVNRLEHMKKSPEAVSGFSLALASLLAASRESELGIPFCKSRQVFTAAEDMIKTATQSPKLAQRKINAGWLLVSAVISLGSPFVRHNVGRLLMLWKYSFPRSVDEAKAEKQRGDTFTWESTLESRAGALASMEAFINYCPELATEDIIKKMLLAVETCLTTMALVAELLLSHGVRLRHPIYLMRIRLYSLLGNNKMKLKNMEHILHALLRELVADITMTDNAQAATISSQTSSLCTAAYLELECHSLQTMLSGSLEYDTMYLVHGNTGNTNMPCCSSSSMEQMDSCPTSPWPEPLPSNVVAIDVAIALFSRVFPVVQTKRKLQLVTHFLTCIKAVKQTPRLYAIQVNILGAICCAMKAMGEQRAGRIDDEELQRQLSVNLVMPFLNAEKPLLKCLAIETLGRIAQAVAEPQFVAGNAQYCFDKLRSIRDEKSRTGYALSLGCLHRYMGSLGSGQHLNTSVSIILALAQDNSSPIVQSWSILSLSLIASTGGGMFRGYVEPSLSLCLRLLLSTSPTHVDVILAVAKLTSALITAVGPELSTTIGTIEHTRTSFLIACSMMFEHSDPQIKSEAIYCLQQLHLFAPRFVQLDRLVVNICNILYSEHLVLRKAAVCCLRQLLQREAKEVREHAQNLVPAGIIDIQSKKGKENPLPETGLEGALFELLDVETDKEMRQYIKESLLFLVHATSGELLNFWLTMCKDILASSTNPENIRSTLYMSDETRSGSTTGSGSAMTQSTSNTTGLTAGGLANSGGDGEEHEEHVCSNDEDILQVVQIGDSKVREKVTPRWPTRVFGFEIVQKLLSACETERAHLDLALAKELQMSSGDRADYLVLHLSDLVRMGFMGATSDNSALRLSGLNCLQDVIIRFSAVPEPGIIPRHVLLEQFQSQVGAALRPAFEPNTPSHVTAAACQVCSTWIGSGVARDLNDLRRVHQLLVSSLGKLRHGSINTQLYNESAATLEKLSILKAWAEVYIVAVKQESQLQSTKSTPQHDADQEERTNSESLLSLVNPELNALVGHWLAALKDSALLSLPSEFADQLPESGGAFYTQDSADSCKEYYRNSWPPILLATSIWLRRNNFEIGEKGERREARFHLMVGMCVESLCNSRNHTLNDNQQTDKTLQLCLSTLENLVDCEWTQLELMRDVRLPIEVMNVLHRLILTRDNLHTQRACAEVVVKVLKAARLAMQQVGIQDVENGNIDPQKAVYSGYTGNESGGQEANGEVFDPQKSLSFATLEVCLCLLVRQIPQINSALMKSKSAATLHFRKYTRLPIESYELIQLAVRLLVQVPQLCSPESAVVVLPSVLYMVLGVIRESSRIDSDQLLPDSPPGHVTMAATAAIVALRSLSSLLSLLNMSEGQEIKVDKAVVMLAATVMITSGPPSLSIGSSKSLAKHQLSAPETRNTDKLCKRAGSSIFGKLRPYVLPSASDSNEKIMTETDLPALEQLSDDELSIIQEAIKGIQLVLAFAKGDKERVFTNLLVRCLSRFLSPDPIQYFKPSCPVNTRKIHDFALLQLNAIGKEHSEAFKAVLNSCPAIHHRLELAAQFMTANKQAELQRRKSVTSAGGHKTSGIQPAQPTIKLAMDFSAFNPPERKLSSILATDFPSVQREIHRRHSYPPEEHTEETIQTDLNRSYPRGHGQQPKVVFVDELEKRMEDKENLILHKENLKSTDKETCLRTRAECKELSSTVIKEYNLKTVLQNESSQVVPAVEKFVQSNLDGSTTNSVNENDELEVKLMGLKHIETPLKHYWDKVFRVGNGSKSATIRIESLLNMEINDNKITGFSNANYVPQHRPSSVSTQQLLFKTNVLLLRPILPTSSHYSISPTSDYDSSSSSSQTDLLSVVHRKIHQKIKLDWSDLFLLKNAHCRFVLPPYAKELEIEIIKNYKHYQLVLEECVVIDKLYTQLAFYIMKAEAYWYAARTTSDICLRNHSYNVASRRYIELLTLAKEHLSPDDRSLLTILEKVSTVLVECTVYGTLGNFRTQQDSTTFVQNCRQAVVEAEKTTVLILCLLHVAVINANAGYYPFAPAYSNYYGGYGGGYGYSPSYANYWPSHSSHYGGYGNNYNTGYYGNNGYGNSGYGNNYNTGYYGNNGYGNTGYGSSGYGNGYGSSGYGNSAYGNGYNSYGNGYGNNYGSGYNNYYSYPVYSSYGSGYNSAGYGSSYTSYYPYTSYNTYSRSLVVIVLEAVEDTNSGGGYGSHGISSGSYSSYGYGSSWHPKAAAHIEQLLAILFLLWVWQLLALLW